MPDADTVWLVPSRGAALLLERVGLRGRWQQECTSSHRAMAGALLAGFVAERASITEGLPSQAFEDLVAAQRLWSDWLAEGRGRKFALVAERVLPG